MRRFARWMLIALLATALGMWPLSSVVHAASIVTSLADDGSSGTLRSVIAAAAPGDTITFQPELTGTILLDTSLGALNLTKNVIIQGPGASIIAVDSRCPTCGAGGMPSGGITVFTLTITMASATISGLTIQHGNGDSCCDAGGIQSFGTLLTVADCTVSGNSGGGVASYGPLIVTGSTIAGNATAGDGTGSGVSTKNNVGGQLPTTATITNSTIVGNTATGTGATGLGGGIYHKYDSGTNFKSTVQLIYTTIARNTASTGGGVRNEDALQSLGTIIAANSGGDCSILAPGAITSQGYNLDDDGSCSLTMPTDRPNDANPGLAPALAANGSAGPQTLALIAGSDAIDHGGMSANGCPTTDERGITRPQGAACDIGAFEAPATLTPRPAPPPRPGPPPLGGPPRPIPTPRPGPSPSGGLPLPLPILRQ